MGNALLFTACLLGAAVLGGFIGSCCAKRRQNDEEAIQIKDRLEYLEGRTQYMDERLYDCEMLIGETPNDGLLNRVGALEEARRKEDLLLRVNILTDENQDLASQLDTLQGRLDAFENSMTLEMTTLREELEMRHG